ncbi:hypothetical protein LWI28_020736 [Acer negundo]|uniref:Uncharacterized protein n=1 Tax=Acer negundo TaxID=4023 RepID=A0AAD5IA61_ACENE|nr:hypothetical protein LWI28_020736 [Acer negundo]
MAPRINTFLLVFLLLLLIPLLSPSGGMVEGFKDDMHPKYSLYKDGIQMKKMRKLLMVDAVLDYDDAGANTKHDPPKKKPGGGKP